MISEIVNLSTGPVGISSKVMNAFREPPISHRSVAFKKLYNKTTDLLSAAFHVKKTFLLTGTLQLQYITVFSLKLLHKTVQFYMAPCTIRLDLFSILRVVVLI